MCIVHAVCYSSNTGVLCDAQFAGCDSPERRVYSGHISGSHFHCRQVGSLTASSTYSPNSYHGYRFIDDEKISWSDGLVDFFVVEGSPVSISPFRRLQKCDTPDTRSPLVAAEVGHGTVFLSICGSLKVTLADTL